MADVLNIFYEALANTNSQLYLFGDRMQQIYMNYDGSFEERFALFNPVKMTTNYRSVTEIVTILNRLYHDPEFIQDNSDAMKQVKPDFPPRVIISNDVSTVLAKLQEEHSDTLVLYLFNKERFSAIGASNLFQAFSRMNKYSFGRSYSAVDVLTAPYEENPDTLLKLSYCVMMFSYIFVCDFQFKNQYSSSNSTTFAACTVYMDSFSAPIRTAFFIQLYTLALLNPNTSPTPRPLTPA